MAVPAHNTNCLLTPPDMSASRHVGTQKGLARLEVKRRFCLKACQSQTQKKKKKKRADLSRPYSAQFLH